MAFLSFKNHELIKVSEALYIAEDATVNYFKFSSRQWGRHRYDVKTLSFLKKEDVRPGAFALLNKSSRPTGGFEFRTRNFDFYLICLNDHHILNAVERDGELFLLPLLVYVFTHELVHIVRFCNFFQRFDAPSRERDREETVVHAKTFEILKKLSMPRLDYVLDSYRDHRVCDLAI